MRTVLTWHGSRGAPRLQRAAGRAGSRGIRSAGGDTGPSLRRGLLGGGAHVRCEDVAGAGLVLRGGTRGVPGIGEQHSDGDRGDR